MIVGSGTEYIRIKAWFNKNKPSNASLIPELPKSDYDELLAACDVGLIFLNKMFTIPNYPSRLLSYLEMKMPVIAATDRSSDVGIDIEKNKCGFAVLSGNTIQMKYAIDSMMKDPDMFNQMRENSWKYLNKDFHVNRSSELILNALEEK